MSTESYGPGKNFSKNTKEEVFRRCRGTCQICGGYLDPTNDGASNMGLKWHAHHILPKEDGGWNTPDNCLIICDDCHKRIHKIQRIYPRADFRTVIEIYNKVVQIRQMRGAGNAFGQASFDEALQYFREHYRV